MMPAPTRTRSEALAEEVSFEERAHEARDQHRHLIGENSTRHILPRAPHAKHVVVRIHVNLDPYALAVYRSLLATLAGQGGARARLTKKRTRMAIRKIERRQRLATQPSYRGHR